MRIVSRHRLVQKAFTITELMVTGSFGLFVMASILTGHLIGVRMFQSTKSKLGGNDDARRALGSLIEEIRTSKLVKVGSGSLSGFTECAVNASQQGNAVQIYPTTATNVFIRYYRSDVDNCLHRMTNGTTSAPVLASFITNSLVFTAENFQGTILTNNENNRVIGLTMQFYQIQYPVVKIGTNCLYDFYQVRTKITRRTLE